MDCEQEIKDLGEIVLDLAERLLKQEKELDDLRSLFVKNTQTSTLVMDALKNALAFQQEHLGQLDQKLIHMKWAIEELEKK